MPVEKSFVTANVRTSIATTSPPEVVTRRSFPARRRRPGDGSPISFTSTGFHSSNCVCTVAQEKLRCGAALPFEMS